MTVIDRRPIVTCAGELEVFAGLEESLSVALPSELCEWRRSLGRTARDVRVGARFVPFSGEALPREGQWDLVRQPLFHTYWTECSDVEAYKAGVRDDIERWLRDLNARGISDWLIVVVETWDARRANKLLPRTTVLDRIRADWASRHGDRCISVLRPAAHGAEHRTADSWRGLVARVRYLVLVAYARAVARLEEHVRKERERRNESGWRFVPYFRLQEELAEVLATLGLHDEALVQYDELDALLSQFVVNGHAGDAAEWLSELQAPLERWRSLALPSEDENDTEPLGDAPSLLELRAYLFGRQARSLLRLERPEDVAERCLAFAHACAREMKLLEVSAPAGALSCWLFLACVEVLRACDGASASLHTAALWSYASGKLRELGELCGLLPSQPAPTSEQLHAVVQLSAGMGDRPGPTDRLREALRSRDSFRQHYLELCELALGTYKHVGRARSARLVGRELAEFHRQLGDAPKAAAFLVDALRTFEQEGWRDLAAHAQRELATCHAAAGDWRKFARAAAAVAAAPEADMLERCARLDDLLSAVAKFDRSLILPFSGAFRLLVLSMRGDAQSVVHGTDVEFDVEIECGFPRAVLATDVLLSLEIGNKNEKESEATSDDKCERFEWHPSLVDAGLRRLRIERHLDYRQDKHIHSASVVLRGTPLRRADSTARTWRSDFVTCARFGTEVQLTPGINSLRLQWNAIAGKFSFGQIRIDIGQAQFVSEALTVAGPKLNVQRKESTLRLDKIGSELLAGLPQPLELAVIVGSAALATDAIVRLRSSRGLSLSLNNDTPDWQSELEIPINHPQPYTNSTTQLLTFSELPLPREPPQVTVRCSWIEQPLVVPLCFTAPLTAQHRLHTAAGRKFIHITLFGQASISVRVQSTAKLLAEKGSAHFKDLNPGGDARTVSTGMNVAYMWELVADGQKQPLKLEFSTEYAAENDKWRSFVHMFELTDYETLYVVEARVEPSKGSEFCRVGALCHLRLTIRRAVNADADHADQEDAGEARSLMYEVLAEQSVWAVCGRTAGVVSVGGGRQAVSLDVMPLASGYLPLPLVRLSKYIPAGAAGRSDHPRLEPFSPGQVYNASKGRQVHVLAAAGDPHPHPL